MDNRYMLGTSPKLSLLAAAYLRTLKVTVIITDLEVEAQTVQEWVEVTAEGENQPISLNSVRVNWSQLFHEGSHFALSLKSCIRSTARRNRPPVSAAVRRH